MIPNVVIRDRAQPTTFRIQISFLILVTGHAIGLLVLVDNDYFSSLASPTASSGPELKSETAPNSKSGRLRSFSGHRLHECCSPLLLPSQNRL